MSKRHYFRASAALGAISLAFVTVGTHSGPADAQAAAATAPAATAPNVVVSRPPAAAAPAAPAPAASAPVTLATAPAPPPGGGPAGAVPRVIVIDRNFILQRSAAGQEMLAQAQNLSKQAETEFKAQEVALTTEAGQLQQQLAILAPDVRDQKEKDFTSKQQAFQARVTQRQAEIQAGFNKTARQLEVALEPILKAIMTERGANMVLDRTSVILSSVDIDVTPVAVQRLDKALPHVKVELTAVPAGAAPTAAARPATAPVVAPAAPVKK